MTEPTEPTPADDVAELEGEGNSPQADDDTDVPQTIEQARKLRSENKNLRARLHTSETEREAAVTRLAAADRREIERIAGQVLIDPSDVWSAQPDSSAFYDDEFHDIVGDKVVEAAKAVIAAKPHLAKPPTAPPPTARPIEGLRAGARAPEEASPTTWAGAIRGISR